MKSWQKVAGQNLELGNFWPKMAPNPWKTLDFFQRSRQNQTTAAETGEDPAVKVRFWRDFWRGRSFLPQNLPLAEGVFRPVFTPWHNTRENLLFLARKTPSVGPFFACFSALKKHPWKTRFFRCEKRSARAKPRRVKRPGLEKIEKNG